MNKAPDDLISPEPDQVGDVPTNAADAALPPHLESRREQMFPKLDSTEINRLRRFGTVHTWQPGEVLFEPGTPGPGMIGLLRWHILTTCKTGLSIEIPI